MELTQSYLKTQLHYDPITGAFTRIKSGEEPGYIDKYMGYRIIYVGGVYVPAHRLAFLYVSGLIPQEIDHINRIRCDNRWTNLRACTRAENTKNKRLYKNSKSGITGVRWSKESKKWQAYIKVDGKMRYLGYHKTIFEAACNRISAQNNLGFNSDHGRKSGGTYTSAKGKK